MTTFDQQESSRTLGKPINLYLFRYGPGELDYFAYTDAERNVTVIFEAGAITFLPIAITRDEVNVSGSTDKAQLQVKTPHNADLATMFMETPPSQVVTLSIWEGHVGSDDMSLEWAGRVLSHATADNEATYTCESIATAAKRPGLMRNWQIHCPLALYQQGPNLCNADQVSATITVHITSASGGQISLPDDWEVSADRKLKYVAGMATWTRPDGIVERRTIVKFLDGDTHNLMLLSAPATGLEAAIDLQLALGCNHDLDDCENLHNNIQNYGGQWLIPNDNPFGVKNSFY